jgi:hypothetical protein
MDDSLDYGQLVTRYHDEVRRLRPDALILLALQHETVPVQS